MASAVLALIVENKRRLHIRPRCCTKHTYVVTRMKLSCASHQLSHWRVATLHAFWGSLQLAEAATKQLRATAQCTASRRLKPAENKFTQSGLTSFSMQVSANSNSFRFRLCQALHIQNLSNRCRYKYDPSISRILWFLIFGGFLTFGATVYRRRLRLYGSSGDRCDGFTHTGGRHWRPRTSSVTRPRRYTHTLGRAYALPQPY